MATERWGVFVCVVGPGRGGAPMAAGIRLSSPAPRPKLPLETVSIALEAAGCADALEAAGVAAARAAA